MNWNVCRRKQLWLELQLQRLHGNDWGKLWTTCQDSWYPKRDLNWALPDCIWEVVPFEPDFLVCKNYKTGRANCMYIIVAASWIQDFIIDLATWLCIIMILIAWNIYVMCHRMLTFVNPDAGVLPFCDRPFYIIFSTFRDWFEQIRMRLCGWQICFTHSPVVVQFTLSSVMLCLVLSKVEGCHIL